MNIPGSLGELLLFMLFVLPGITFSTVRIALGGWRAPDLSVGARILEALFVSAIFDGVYLLILAELLVEKAKSTTDFLALVSTFNVLLTLLLLIALPAAVAAAVTMRLRIIDLRKAPGHGWFRIVSLNNFRSIPQAWDFVVMKAGGQFVRVRTETGVFYGGWYSSNSLASTYPHDRDIFIESQWLLNKNGEFIKKMKNTAGIWIPVTDKTIVEWLEPPASNEGELTNG